jgi:hypothetical protein
MHFAFRAPNSVFSLSEHEKIDVLNLYGKGLFIWGFGLKEAREGCGGCGGCCEGYLADSSREHSSSFCRDQKGAAAKGHVVLRVCKVKFKMKLGESKFEMKYQKVNSALFYRLYFSLCNVVLSSGRYYDSDRNSSAAGGGGIKKRWNRTVYEVKFALHILAGNITMYLSIHCFLSITTSTDTTMYLY